MMDAGMGLLPSLQLLADQEGGDENWEATKWSIVKQVESGYSFSKALSNQGDTFGKGQIVAIKSGEKAGALGSVLSQLEEKLVDEQRAKAQLKKALTYPLFLVAISLGGTFLLFKYVLPGILASTQTGQSSFLPTKILVLSVAFINSWFGTLLIIASVALVVLILRKPTIQRAIFMSSLELPMIGPLLINSACLEFATNFKLLVASGTPAASAVEFSLTGSDSPALRAASPRITRRIMHGDSVWESFQTERALFSHLLLDMLALIDETSEYEKSLQAAIAYLSFDVEQRVEQFLNIIEPVILILISSMIAFVAVSVVVPIVQLSATM
jgi:type IV pilus assembly protein PilC